MKKLLKGFDYFFIGFSYLASKKIIAILVVCLFVSLLKTSFAYQEELEVKEERLNLIENDMIYEKTSTDISYYNDEVDRIDYGEGTAILDYIACYQEGINMDEVPQNISDQINKLKGLFDESQQYYSFYYQDLFSGFTVSYNEDSPIFTASTIKAPAMIYLYEKASAKEIDLNESLVYDGRFYSEGSGVLKSKELGTSYTVGELIYYAIHYSDNIAYAMLMNHFSKTDILAFWNNLGTKHIFTQNTIWGITSAKDASIYMKELYRFSKKNEEYGTVLMDYFKGSDWKMVTDKDGNFYTASKGGWAGTAIHDAAIVFDENPYILIVMSNTGESNYSYLFKNASEMVGDLHEEYWKYKVDTCKKIAQY